MKLGHIGGMRAAGYILGIETSCDDTGVALVREGCLVGQALSTQSAHAEFGGVVPEIAAREHHRLLPVLYDRLLLETGVDPGEIRVVGVARGPGLLGCLLTGVSFAKGLSLGLSARLTGVDHLKAHLLAAGLELGLEFPALGLLASGGHTELCRMDSPLLFQRLGRTLDDAMGEAFDKCAKLLGLPYPGGPLLDRVAGEGRVDKTRFPVPYVDNANLDFSFSGLKTAAAVALEKSSGIRIPIGRSLDDLDSSSRRVLADFAASFIRSLVRGVMIKLDRALSASRGVRSLVAAGGCAANSSLRAALVEFAQKKGLNLVLPSPGLCTDNAAMIAYAAWIQAKAGRFHGLDLEAIPRGREIPEDFV